MRGASTVISGEKKRALGRGLGALIPQAGAAAAHAGNQVLKVPIEDVRRDGSQPRKVFDEERLKELAASIRAQGVLQPVLVRRDGGRYRLIAGERRWRAAQLAGLKEIPALVREATDAQAFELALVENLQRADLNPIEEAAGYKRLLDEHRLTQEQISQRVGKDRSSVANALRLLGLPEEVKGMLADGSLSMGHARALLGLERNPDRVGLAHRILEERLSVRDVERLVAQGRGAAGAPGQKKKDPKATPAVRALIDDLQRRLGTKVRLTDRSGKGTLEIDYFSYEDLDRIVALLRR